MSFIIVFTILFGFRNGYREYQRSRYWIWFMPIHGQGIKNLKAYPDFILGS
ncbi:MAG: hypothetical protein GXO88_13465 [Chlorobi bacterium]|nr:hypothetical protein [Chlorobiota bacterium]